MYFIYLLKPPIRGRTACAYRRPHNPYRRIRIALPFARPIASFRIHSDRFKAMSRAATAKDTSRRGVTRLARNPARGAAEPSLTLRVDFGEQGAIGPGKIRLLELIDEKGSIAAAGRAMAMSYRRAWLLVDSLNQTFSEPLVATQHGGSAGGGAGLTPLGQNVVKHYRAMEDAAHTAAASHLKALGHILSR
jgi:molybdate transport system regulatory protein